METIRQKYEGKDENHVVLTPKDIRSFIVIMQNSQRVINNISPWNTPDGIKGTLGILKCYQEKLENALIETVEENKV